MFKYPTWLLASTFSEIWEGKNLDRWKTSVAFGGVCEEAPFPLFFNGSERLNINEILQKHHQKCLRPI